MLKIDHIVTATCLCVLTGSSAAQTGPGAAERFFVRDGYRVTAISEELAHARFLEFDDQNTLYVSMMIPGEIVALRDEDGDGFFEKMSTYLGGKRGVHGMDFHDGWLWFATVEAIYRSRDTDLDGKADEIEEVISFTRDLRGAHNWRPILVTDQHIYTGIGDSGNITDERDTDRQKIFRFDHDGSGRTLFASGIRNTEKLRIRPGSEEIWGCDHGSDWFGRRAGDRRGQQPITDMNPPDEFNRYVQGGFYGHPFITGKNLPRYEFIDESNIDIVEMADRNIAPEWTFPAHWAVNGFCFVDPEINNRTDALPRDHNGDAFIAAHGSWNREVPDGYCVARILFDDGKPYGMLKIVSTISEDRKTTYGRPVDCVQSPDGDIIFSCDYTNRLYRITHTGD